MNNTLDRDLGLRKTFKVFNSSILFMDDMKNVIISNANSILNNLDSELPNLFNYNAGSLSVVVSDKLKKYVDLFGQEGAIQLLTYDALFFSVTHFKEFLLFTRGASFDCNCLERKSVTSIPELREELDVLTDGISTYLGYKVTRSILINYMIEFLLKEKEPKVEYAILPSEIGYISFKLKDERNSHARGYKRRIMTYIYSKIIIQAIHGIYKEPTWKDIVVINLPTKEEELSKATKAFKDIELRSREELSKMLVAGKNGDDKPKPKFDISLLNEEEQTMKDALNDFMIPYGNRYVYEDEVDVIVSLLNRVANNSISLQQLKSALV